MELPEYLTPPEFAKLYGIGQNKVLAFIHAGELEAVDLSLNRGKRPRWRISREAAERFERRRSSLVNATPPSSPRPRKPAARHQYV